MFLFKHLYLIRNWENKNTSILFHMDVFVFVQNHSLRSINKDIYFNIIFQKQWKKL